MKLLILATLLITVSCGKNDPFPYNIAKGIGAEETGDIDKVKSDVDELEERVKALEDSLASVISDARTLEETVLDLNQELLDAIEEGDEETKQVLQSQINALQAGANTMQIQINGLLSRLVAIETQERVTEIVDPCPNVSATWREVVIKTSSGKFFAYFESGSTRFLTVLPPGNYRTTDSRACNFSI